MQDDRITHWNTNYSKGNDFGPIPSSMLRKILEQTNLSLPKTCLDVGCGTGQLTRELFHHGYSCIGIDISDKAIALAKQNTIYHDELEYIQEDAEKLGQSPLSQRSYSLITCKLVFAFIQDRSHFLETINQLLTNGGLFVLITPINEPGKESPIAVSFDEVKMSLDSVFSQVNTLPGLGVTYFTCKKE